MMTFCWIVQREVCNRPTVAKTRCAAFDTERGSYYCTQSYPEQAEEGDQACEALMQRPARSGAPRHA
jgi:hypothetical protein